MNGSNGDTRPPLHIGASRIVDFPSGTSSAEFLIASLRDFFSLRCGLALRLKKRFEQCYFYGRDPTSKSFLVQLETVQMLPL